MADIGIGVTTSEETRSGHPFFYSQIVSQFRFLEGNILTVVDAAFSDREQRKAVKDLVRGHIREQLKYIESCCFDRSSELTAAPEAVSDN